MNNYPGYPGHPAEEMRPCRRCARMTWDGEFCQCVTPEERRRFMEVLSPLHETWPQPPTSTAPKNGF